MTCPHWRELWITLRTPTCSKLDSLSRYLQSDNNSKVYSCRPQYLKNPSSWKESLIFTHDWINCKRQSRTKSMPAVNLLWPQIQEVIWSLPCRCKEASGVVRARLHMNYTMLLLFTVTPGQAKELRTLCLSTKELIQQELHKLAKSFPEGHNAIIFSS